MIKAFAANAHVAGVRKISERDKSITLVLPLDQIALTLESQPLAPDSWLAEVLGDVLSAVENMAYDHRFVECVESLLSAIQQAIPILEAQETEPDASVHEIVADLERALLVSLVLTLTSHREMLPREGEWAQEHQRFLNGHRDFDLGHYFEIRTFSFVDAPGPGRVHMQHIVSACDAGMTLYVAGAAEPGHVEHHPEMLAVTYAQWFAYIFAIWEEQFRDRLARFWDTQTDVKIRRSDILVDYFGDIRLIRNDFVHNKGICSESANVRVLQWNLVKGEPIEIDERQMGSLIAFFPKTDLQTPPIPRPSSGLKSVPGKVDAQLLEDVKARARELGMSENTVAESAFSRWLEANTQG
ncbi:hypothetical protein [Mycobacteroides abscessus]|uniref:hypothetical protein n=1 Tax=Mycobacteroides abscessus TaxID=36809 RepID=UPI001F30A2A1|nr:hypothetical protein [Mycobacteroides abscessus]